MAEHRELLGVFMAVEFVVLAVVVLVVVPFEAAAPLVPLALVLSLVLYWYLSS